MTETVNHTTFIATLTEATIAAAKAYPMLTPIYINIDDAKDWMDTGDYEDYHPIDPAGKFFYNFATARGTKVTKKCAKSFVRQYGDALYDIFNEFLHEDLTHTDAMVVALADLFNKDLKNTAKPVNVALVEADAAVDAPADDETDVEAVVADTEGNEEAAAEEPCDEPAQEEAAIEVEENTVANEQEDAEEAAETEVVNEQEAEEQEEAEASTAPAIEQPKRRGPQPLPRVKLEPGAVNVRSYKGKEYTVQILADGKRCTVDGVEFSSLSTAALRMFDLHMSGVKFWGFTH